jgi:hypothetical protein
MVERMTKRGGSIRRTQVGIERERLILAHQVARNLKTIGELGAEIDDLVEVLGPVVRGRLWRFLSWVGRKMG